MAKFKVLLIYPNLQMVNLLPTNIAVLAAYLKEHDIDVALFDTTLYRTSNRSVDDIRVEHLQLRPFNLKEKGVGYNTTDIFDDFLKIVDGYKPDLMAVSATDDTFDLGMSLVSRARGRGIPVVVGGVFPTFEPHEAINNENVDFICMGEGEDALVELCRYIQKGKKPTGLKNIWAKIEGEVYQNPIREPIEIETLPYDDFSVFDDKRFFRPMQGKVYRMLPVAIDRGCLFNCSFCAAPVIRHLYRKTGGRQYFRIKSTKRILKELTHYISKYKADYIYFNSETFFSRKEKDIEEFGEEYASKIHLPFWCQTRIETISTRMVRVLKRMGCDRISLGIEHGNEKFRRSFLRKPFTNKEVSAAFEILNNNGMKVT
ncbi:MAG: radical SAM protein, partial [Candidatus Omnitrophota bacterium]